jgi:hypothetical protein
MSVLLRIADWARIHGYKLGHHCLHARAFRCLADRFKAGDLEAHAGIPASFQLVAHVELVKTSVVDEPAKHVRTAGQPGQIELTDLEEA